MSKCSRCERMSDKKLRKYSMNRELKYRMSCQKRLLLSVVQLKRWNEYDKSLFWRSKKSVNVCVSNRKWSIASASASSSRIQS